MKERAQRVGLLQRTGAFLFGAALGSIFALLYAPTSGQVTRRRLGLKARSLKRAVARRLDRTQRVLVTKAARVRDAATEWIAEHVPHGNGRSLIRRRELRHAEAR